MPTNLYGPGDDFDLESSHVIPALIRKCHNARAAGSAAVEVRGTGAPRREFLHVDDMSDACVRVMELDADTAIPPCQHPAHALAHQRGDRQGRDHPGACADLKEVVGFPGEIRFDPSNPDGTPRKLPGVSRLGSLGWRAKTDLRSGPPEQTYDSLLANRGQLRA